MKKTYSVLVMAKAPDTEAGYVLWSHFQRKKRKEREKKRQLYKRNVSRAVYFFRWHFRYVAVGNVSGKRHLSHSLMITEILWLFWYFTPFFFSLSPFSRRERGREERLGRESCLSFLAMSSSFLLLFQIYEDVDFNVLSERTHTTSQARK